MNPSPCKIVFLYRSGGPGLPEWLGPAFAGAVALLPGSREAMESASSWKELLAQGKVFFALEEIPAAKKSSLEERRQAFARAEALLLTRLGRSTEVLSYLASDESLQRFRPQKKPAVVIVPEKSPSADLKAAGRILDHLVEARLEELRWENPRLPWAVADAAGHLNFLREHPGAGLHEVTHPELLPVAERATRKARMLLHVCCGPDAAGVIPQLKNEFELECFWYDPNIQPAEEHDKRVEAFKKVAELYQVPYVIGEYDVDHFFQRIEGLEHTPEQGAKCSHCYDMRLERAARQAAENDFDYYTTTLAISPHKVQEKLKNFGELNHKKYRVPYVARNFMKHEGFKQSVAFTREHEIYRQDYCGCYFSLHEGGAEARALAERLQVKKEDLQPGYQNPFRTAEGERLS